MPTIDFAAIGGILTDLGINILSYAGIAAILYAIGGILIRTVSWTFDKQLINFIGYAYKYFETIVDGTLLTDSVVRGMMNRVYLLIGVIIAFRLGMLLFSYILNPSDVMDEKIGVNALVKRIVIGMILIIFIPNIFGLAFEIQKAILKDQVIEQIIMDESTFKTVNEYKENHGIGKIIGMSVFSGFFHLTEDGKGNAKVKRNYEKATDIQKDYDLSIIDELELPGLMNSGILSEISDDYVHDYFPIFSTVVLCYILYLLVKFCLDAVVRSFKLSVLQIIAPIAIVEYMINNDRNEVFKTWRKASVATFAMLFMRVVSLWFVAYVTLLMQPGAIALAAGETTLLQTSDDLLKAVIILGLLAFMMEFPKLMSEVFGLDLEQDSSVKNVLGKAAGGAMAGLALGGAVAGVGMKVAGAAKGTLKGGLTKMAGKDSSFAKGLNNPIKSTFGQVAGVGPSLGLATKSMVDKMKGKGTFKDNYKDNKDKANQWIAEHFGEGTKADKVKKVGGAFVDAAKENHLGTTLAAGAMAMGAAALASNKFTGSASNSYRQASDSVDGKVSRQEGKEDKEKAQLEKQQAELSQMVRDQALNNPSATKDDIISSIVDAQIKAKLDVDDIGEISAKINAKISDSDSPQTFTRYVHEELASKLGMSQETTTRIVNDVLGDSAPTPEKVTQVVESVVNNSPISSSVTQTANQVMGTDTLRATAAGRADAKKDSETESI